MFDWNISFENGFWSDRFGCITKVLHVFMWAVQLCTFSTSLLEWLLCECTVVLLWHTGSLLLTLAVFVFSTQESGGIMTMADVYCRFNRARGMELVSPDDLTNACKMFETLKQPMRLELFDWRTVCAQVVHVLVDCVELFPVWWV